MTIAPRRAGDVLALGVLAEHAVDVAEGRGQLRDALRVAEAEWRGRRLGGELDCRGEECGDREQGRTAGQEHVAAEGDRRKNVRNRRVCGHDGKPRDHP